MSQLKPFKAFRPKSELAGKVASVPYDTINTEEARQLAAGNAYSFFARWPARDRLACRNRYTRRRGLRSGRA